MCVSYLCGNCKCIVWQCACLNIEPDGVTADFWAAFNFPVGKCWARILVSPAFSNHLFLPPQITRLQYQNGLMASRLESCPQTPEGAPSKLDTSLSEKGDSAAANETTSLLNERNSQHYKTNHSPPDNVV